MNRWFSSDHHFSHEAIIKYCNRPFKDKYEHDGALIENWNKLVKRNDLVYHLGDFCFGSHKTVRHFRNRLNGKIILIMGNHDYKSRIHKLTDLFTEIHDYRMIKVSNKQALFLCHYCMRVWPRSHFNVPSLYGHSHGGLEGIGKQMDVGVDTNNFKPYHVDEIIEIMESKPDNFNLVKNT